MKVSRPVLSFYLRTARKNKLNQSQIVLRISFNGRKEIYTSIWIESKFWGDGFVKKSCPNSQLFNSQLLTLKQSIERIINELETKGLPYTCEKIVSLYNDSLLSKDDYNSLVFSSLCDRLIEDRCLKYNTVKNYRLTIEFLDKYCGRGKSIMLNELDEVFMRKFCKWMSMNIGDESSNYGTINCVCSKIASVWNYAIGLGLVSSDLYCFKNFKYNREYIPNIVKKAVSEDNIISLQNYFIQKCIIVDAAQGLFTYDSVAYSQLQLRYTKEFALLCYLLMYRLNGLAVADMAMIKVNQIKVIEVGGIEYYKFEGIRRRKTGVPVSSIIVEKDEIGMAILEVLIQTAHLRDGYLLPIVCDNLHSYNYDTEKKLALGLVSSETIMNRKLREVICDINKSYDLNIDENISFYSGRHSWATHYIKSGGEPIKLAKMLGRSPSGIFRYVDDLMSDEQIIKEREKVFKK